VVPALIRKFHEARLRGDASVTVWGTGTPRREFLYSDDMADACVALLRLDDARFQAAIGTYPPLVNIGSGSDQTIRELAEAVAPIVGFRGALRFDASKPDGTPRKLLDVSRIAALGWRPRVALPEGIARTYEFFQREVVAVA
jgi:GDP-L-fucose synthase